MKTLAKPFVISAPRLLTAADLAALPTSLPTGDVKYELNDGELVVMAPPGDIHARKQGLALIKLLEPAEQLGLGEWRAEVGIVLRRNPDRIVGADAAFILKASLPVRHSPEGYLETIPELIIEIRSKNDTLLELIAKTQEYLQAGAQCVWIIEPEAQRLSAHFPDGSVSVFGPSDTLTSPLLPGFAVPLTNLLR